MVSKFDRPSPSTSGNHVDATSSTSDGKKKGKIIFPCRLCEGYHLLHLFPLTDKASKFLEILATPQPKLLVSYQRLSSNPLPVGKEINLDSSVSRPTLPEQDSLVSIPNQPLVEKSVDFTLPSIFHSILGESGGHAAHVLLFSSNSHELKSDPPILVVQESPSPIPVQHGGNHMIPPPNSYVISFN